MYGIIFSEYVKDCKYWGYCDSDMIIGDLDSFLNIDYLSEYDLIIATNNLVGYMTLFKNTESINNLAKKSPDYDRIINSSTNFRFDECGNKKIVALEQLLKQENIKTGFVKNCIHNDYGKNNRDREWQYLWSSGSLIDCLTGLEIGALHPVKSKKDPEFLIEILKDKRQFLIDRRGIRNL